MVSCEPLDEDPSNIIEAQALVCSLKGTFEAYPLQTQYFFPPEILMRVSRIKKPGGVADIIVTFAIKS